MALNELRRKRAEGTLITVVTIEQPSPTVGAIESAPVARVAFVSALLGFGIGAFLVPSWQDAVETGQVISGVVSYPIDNPFYRYNVTLWTLACQLSALGLSIGMSAHVLSVVMSGVLGASYFVGASLTVLGLSRQSSIAVLTPIVLFTLFETADQFGVAYPVFSMGHRSTHGILGRNMLLVALGLLACGKIRAAAALIGLMPAIHPTLGAWTLGIIVITLVTSATARGLIRNDTGVAFSAGFAITIASFAVQQYLARGMPSVDPSLAAQYRETFIAYWDSHRFPPDLIAHGVFAAIACAVLCTWFLRLHDLAGDDARRTALVFWSTASIIGLALVLMSHAGAYLPDIVTSLIPARFVNTALLAYPALLFGVMAAHPHPPARWLLYANVLVIMLARAFPGSHVVFRETPHLLILVASTALLIALPARKHEAPDQQPARIVTVAVLTIVLLGFAASAGRILRKSDAPALVGAHNHPVLHEVSQGTDMLLTASPLGHMQIRTGRSTMLDAESIDFLPYVPEAGPTLDEIASALYGVSLLDPPPLPPEDVLRYIVETYGTDYQSMRADIPELHPGMIPPGTERALWERRNNYEWRELAEQFRFSDVLVPADWKLALPPVARDETYAYYRIAPDSQ